MSLEELMLANPRQAYEILRSPAFQEALVKARTVHLQIPWDGEHTCSAPSNGCYCRVIATKCNKLVMHLNNNIETSTRSTNLVTCPACKK